MATRAVGNTKLTNASSKNAAKNSRPRAGRAANTRPKTLGELAKASYGGGTGSSD